jgi:transcriptional regulator with XRE-family HTH domain
MSNRPSQKEKKALMVLLRQIRMEAGLRQVDLAVKLRKPQPFVSRYELGERRLDIFELRQVCRALGISLSDFLARFERMLNEG